MHDVRRGRRRFGLDVVAFGLGVVMLGVAAAACAGATNPPGPASGPSTTPASAQTGASGTGTPSTPACTGGQLRAVGSMQGAAGSREGSITLTNFSSTTCRLRGRPTITLLDQHLKPITTGVSFVASAAAWQADALPKPSGWPVVTVKPGVAASFRIRWSNWCPQGRSAPLWRIDIKAGGSVDVVNGMEEAGAPPCNGPGQPSTIEVGPFEPATGA
jgi:hypothetical protein